MRKYSVILFLFILTYNNSQAQTDHFIKVVHKHFNWGARIGFNATSISSFRAYQDGIDISGNAINRVGFQCALFSRTNFGKFFLQPDFSYHLTKEEYRLSLPAGTDMATEQEHFSDVTLEKSSQSANAAMLIGYNIVKSDAYIFNFYAGPNFVWNYANKYKTDELFDNRDSQYKLNLVTGVSANISYLYFDFRCEINLPTKNDIHFAEIKSIPDYLKDITIRESKNILSFSVGMMF